MTNYTRALFSRNTAEERGELLWIRSDWGRQRDRNARARVWFEGTASPRLIWCVWLGSRWRKPSKTVNVPPY